MERPSEAQLSGGRGLVALVGVCCAALGLAYAWPLLHGKIYLDTDLQNFHVPVRLFYQRALREGSDFLWFPFEYAGLYLHGEGQAALYHPLNLLTFRWLPLTLGLNLEMLRSHAFALLGGYWLLRRFALPASAALLGGTLYAFSTFHLLHFMHPNVVGATAHLPWLLLALDVMARGERPLARALAAPLLALLTASEMLLGHLQAVWMTNFVEGLFALWLWRGGAGAGFLARAAAAKLLGLACAAIQLLPTYDSLLHSARASPHEGFRESFSLQLLDFVQLFQPYVFTERVVELETTEFGIYVGAFGALSLVWLALTRRVDPFERRLGRAALVLAFLGALLALGPSGGLYRVLMAIPVVGLFRAPARYGLFLNAASALAAALLFADLVRRPRVPLVPMERAIAIGVPLLSAGFGLALLYTRPESTAGWAPAAAGFATFAALGLLFAAAAAGRRAALPWLLLLACLDLGVYGISYVRQREPEPESFESFYARTPVPSVPAGYRTLEGPISMTMRGARYLRGYVAMWPLRQLESLPGILPSYEELTQGTDFWRAVMSVGSVVSESGWPLPRERLLTQFRVSERPFDDIRATDVASTALVTKPIELDAGAPGEAAIVHDGAGEIRLTTRAPGRQLLVVSEAFHEGWRVWIDDAPSEALRVYGDYIGCVVPAGEHQVRWRFEPASFVWGARLSALGLAGVIVWMVVALAGTRQAIRAARIPPAETLRAG